MQTKARLSALQEDVSRVLPAVFALMFGAFILLGVGFAQSSAVHNAAHDGRHALAFPCH